MNDSKRIPLEISFANKDLAKQCLFRALELLLDNYNSLLEGTEPEVVEFVNKGGFRVNEPIALIHFSDGTSCQLALTLETDPENFIKEDEAENSILQIVR